MSFWDFFKLGNGARSPEIEGLPHKIKTLLPELDDQASAKIAAISGLLCCVAEADFQTSALEIEKIETSLMTWCKLSLEQAKAITKLTSDEVRALASLEIHQYTNILDGLLDKDERIHLLEALFQLAASDGSATSDESELIRHISHGLRLDHHEFISARATVLKKLSFMK